MKGEEYKKPTEKQIQTRIKKKYSSVTTNSSVGSSDSDDSSSSSEDEAETEEYLEREEDLYQEDYRPARRDGAPGQRIDLY